MHTELTYKVTKHNCNYETVERTIRTPKDWGMYTPQGNQAMRKKANTLVKNVLKVKNNSNNYIDYLKCFEKYFKSYERGTRTKTCAESGDTMVREMVWGFAENVGKSVGISYDALDDLWNRRYN